MNTPIRRLSVACLLMFFALMANVTVVQFFQADGLNDRNGNKRVTDDQFSRERGPILVGGEPVAVSVPSDDQFEFQRTYPEGPLYAHLTGYFSYTYGRGAVENSQNRILSGSDNRLFVNRVVDLLADKSPKGGSVELTIDPQAQRSAAGGLAALGGSTKGAVAAIDAETGAVLALATQPSYDPNVLASHDFTAVRDAWNALNADPNQPMTNRATQTILPPGSTFKLVTAAAALADGLDPASEVNGSAGLTFPGKQYVLPNLSGGTCGGETITLERALNISCNVAFGDLALRLGQDKIAEQAAAFGFGDDILDGVAASASRFTTPDSDLEDTQLAQSGIGQYEVAATPLQMALVAAGIANDGVVMQPYLVDKVRAPNLRVLDEAEPQEYSRAMEAEDARQLQQMMVSTVQSGTATSARIDGIEVGGKTGTAQSTQDRPPYAWFVSYGKAGDRTVAVAVVIESVAAERDEIAGGRLAGPIARSVMEAVLAR